MRSAVFDSLKITSSRQSPRISADRFGVDLVPLIDDAPEAVSKRVSPPVPYLSMWLLSSSSRTKSPSHHTRKLTELGLRPALPPEPLKRLVMPSPAPQNSAPALPAKMSPATPRPGPSQLQLFGLEKMVAPLLASRSVAAGPAEPS